MCVYVWPHVPTQALSGGSTAGVSWSHWSLPSWNSACDRRAEKCFLPQSSLKQYLQWAYFLCGLKSSHSLTLVNHAWSVPPVDQNPFQTLPGRMVTWGEVPGWEPGLGVPRWPRHLRGWVSTREDPGSVSSRLGPLMDVKNVLGVKDL